MVWDDYCTQFLEEYSNPEYNEASRKRFQEMAERIMPAILERKNSISQLDAEWFTQALEDEQRKWFVAFAFGRMEYVPENLFEPMIRAAVYERNPSANRRFIDPCLSAFGHRRVNEVLFTFLESGSDFEKAGAVNAFYWAQDVKTIAEHKALTDIWIKKQFRFLQEFVSNEDIQVRRSLIANLDLDPQDYPAELRSTVNQAIQIARAHSDD